jgi:ribosome-associated protein
MRVSRGEGPGVGGPTVRGVGPSGAHNPVNEFSPRTITIDDRPINLTQVLKLGGCVQSGGEAKVRISGGHVRVNGQVELRKRCQMKAGDTVVIEGGPTIVLLAGTPPRMATPEE